MNKYLFLLLAFLCSCGSRYEDEEVLYAIIAKHTSIAAKEGLSPMGTGGAMPDKIKEIIIMYESDLHMDITSARTLYLKMAKELLCIANAHPKLRLYGIKYPFDFENISLSIGFSRKPTPQLKKPIILVENCNNIINYAELSDDRYAPFKDVYKEDAYDYLPELRSTTAACCNSN